MVGSTWKISTIRRVAVFHSKDARCTALDVDLDYTPLEDFAIGATGATVISAAVEGTCEPAPMEELGPGTPGAIVDFNPPSLPSAGAGLDHVYLGDVYWRIWLVPNYMRPQNPLLSVDIPFILWNAYPVPPVNNLTSIGGSGQTGLVLDLSAPRAFASCEQLTVNLQITEAAPVEIYAIYIFNFDEGSGTFIFETVRADWIKIRPEQPVEESWHWMSNIITGWDSTEQRISVRRQPRRRIEYGFILDDQYDRQREYDRWYNKIGTSIIIPFYQYSTRITQDSAVSATKIYFDPDYTDVRDAELVVIYRPSTDESFLLRLDEVEADGATLDSPLTYGIDRRDIVAPAFDSILDNRTGPQMTSVAGSINVSAWVKEFRSSFDRPESAVVLTEFDDLTVLDKRPIVRSPAAEVFDVNSTEVDSPSGVFDHEVSWLHPMVGGIRQFTIPRTLHPEEMDYWRDFLTAIKGKREPFLMPTFRRDLFLSEYPDPGDEEIIIEGANYGSQYWVHDTYKRLQLENSAGEIIYRKVTSVEDVPGELTKLYLDSPLPISLLWSSDFIISFLNKVRLATDQIKLTHWSMYTILELAVRTTDQ